MVVNYYLYPQKQASELISNLAKETESYYVNHRWLGGMLTNWNTINNSIKRLKRLNEDLKEKILDLLKRIN